MLVFYRHKQKRLRKVHSSNLWGHNRSTSKSFPLVSVWKICPQSLLRRQRARIPVPSAARNENFLLAVPGFPAQLKTAQCTQSSDEKLVRRRYKNKLLKFLPGRSSQLPSLSSETCQRTHTHTHVSSPLVEEGIQNYATRINNLWVTFELLAEKWKLVLPELFLI